MAVELRVLRYFLAVAREGTILGAAESLHISQPTLSRQLKGLEEQLGKQLMVRGKHKITLTDEGALLRMRAQKIADLASKTESEIKRFGEFVAGDIHIGGGETEGMRIIAKAAKSLRGSHMDIRVHLYSGSADDVAERLNKGLLDFGLLIDPVDISKYDFIKLPAADMWGVIARKENPLARRRTIKPKDLFGEPLIVPRREMVRNAISGWLGGEFDRLNIVSTYNLIFNAALLVEEGVGSLLCLDGLVKMSVDSALCFRPLNPRLGAGLNLVWKKYQVFSKAAEIFLKHLQKEPPPASFAK